VRASVSLETSDLPDPEIVDSLLGSSLGDASDDPAEEAQPSADRLSASSTA
jgi:hypothetical protein